MPPERPLELRAGDADRETVAQRLRAAHADGRLDVSEVEERLTAAYAAKTLGDLEPLTADLPPDEAGYRAGAEARPRSRSRLRPFREWASVAVILNAIWLITCLAAGELLFYWPMFPLGIWGATIVAGMLFGDGDGDGDGKQRSPKPDERPEPPQLP